MLVEELRKATGKTLRFKEDSTRETVRSRENSDESPSSPSGPSQSSWGLSRQQLRNKTTERKPKHDKLTRREALRPKGPPPTVADEFYSNQQ